MGEVYRGVQPQIGSRVAIKVLSHECAKSPALVERFFAEARAVNVIRHENIVNVIDLSAFQDGRPYIVMEHLEGEPLAAILRRFGPLPLGTLARLMGDVLDALERRARQGHRASRSETRQRVRLQEWPRQSARLRHRQTTARPCGD